MIRRTFNRVLSAVLIVSCLTSNLHAQSSSTLPGADEEAGRILDETKLQESSIAKVYRARVLMEDYRNWAEAYELLRTVLQNEQQLDKVVRKKIKKAASILGSYAPSAWFRRTLNQRHMVRPFLEASYLLNEALMDWRVALNHSSDSEVVFVEGLVQSYLFPGFEAQGKVLYPKEGSYAFDIFALSAENIARARRDRSTAQDPALDPEADTGTGNRPGRNPRTPPRGGSSEGSGPGYVPPLVPPLGPPGSVPLEPDNPDFEARVYQANGFIDGVIDAGASLGEISEEVEKVIKAFKIRDRVTNRYLPQSLMMQALADPGSALFDPQMQAFLKGVRLELNLGESDDSMGQEDWEILKELLGEENIIREADGVRIRLSSLMSQERDGAQSGLELRLKQVKGTSRTVLYAITGVGGGDILWLRTLQAAVTIARDSAAIQAGLSGTAAGLRAASLAKVSLSAIFAALPKAAASINAVAAAAVGTRTGAMLKVLGWSLQRTVSLQNLAVKVGGRLSPHAAKVYRAVANNRYVQNGTVAGVLTFAVAAAQITVGVVQYRNAESADERHAIYVDTLARTGATLTYLLPVVGWGAAAVDVAHAFFGLPFETADVFRGWSWTVESATYWWLGTSRTEVELGSVEFELRVPRADVYLYRHSRWLKTKAEAEQAVVKLRAEFQETAINNLLLLYVAHRTFAQETDNVFGRKQEEYMRAFAKNRTSYRTTMDEILAQINTLPEAAEASVAANP
jgi:hypothetical protein